MQTILRRLCILLAVPLVANAEHPGKQVYTQLCAACHGANGEGVGNGAFPPMKNSEWVKGDNKKIAQILLHGLKGPVSVAGKTYDLQMPAQGALSSQQKVDVINYIQQQWGGKKKDTFTIKMMEEEIKRSSKRKKPWTAVELESAFPKQGLFKNLLIYEYKGNWKKLPDFTKLKAESVEEEHHGSISLRNIQRNGYFGVVWEGSIELDKAGKYFFELGSDDGSRLIINGKEVINHDGTHGVGIIKKGTANLDKGEQQIRFEYFEYTGDRAISLRFKHESGGWQWLSDENKAVVNKKKAAIPIDLTPKADGQVYIYNNFIEGMNARAVAVGFPGGFSYGFGTSNGELELVWKGKFMNARRHWTSRGKGFERPFGDTLTTLSGEKKAAWLVNGAPAKVRFKGYDLDKVGNPTFRYTLNGVEVREKVVPTEGGFDRELSFQSKRAVNLELVLNPAYDAATPNTVGGNLNLEVEGTKVKGATLVKPINVSKSENLKLSYTWTK